MKRRDVETAELSTEILACAERWVEAKRDFEIAERQLERAQSTWALHQQMCKRPDYHDEEV